MEIIRYDAQGRPLTGFQGLETLTGAYTGKSHSTISPFTEECLGGDLVLLDGGLGATTWTANLLCAVPMFLVDDLLVKYCWWENGATQNGAADVGVYNWAGTTKLGSAGSTTTSGASAIQTVNCADFTLSGGNRYWLVFGSDSGTGTFMRANPVAQHLNCVGVKQQAAGYSSGLPASLTLATATVGIVPLFGISGETVI